jgi:tetratricopeptide (TPR) repeat protein
MSIRCSYHPVANAAHTCPKCHDNFCTACIIRKKTEYHGMMKDYFLCPKCRVYTQRIPFTNLIEPYWKRFPHIFRYPLHLHPLLLIFILSFIRTVSAPYGIIGLIVVFVCFGILLTYANLVLFDSSHGSPEPPAIKAETISGSFSIVFKQLAIYALIFFSAYKIFMTLVSMAEPKLAAIGTALFLMAVFFLMPAVFIMLAITKSLFASILPTVFIRLAWRIGWAYLGLCFFLLLLGLAPTAIIGFTWKVLPPPVAAFLITVLSSYYMIVSYHLMGYVLFQYHEQVGYKVDYDEERESSAIRVGPSPIAHTPEDNEKSEFINRINMLIRDGDHNTAIALIEQQATRGELDLAVAERCFNLLKINRRNDDLKTFGRYYMRMLIKYGAKDKIAEVFMTCRSVDEHFLSDDTDALFIAAKALNEGKHYQEAMSVFLTFIEKYPDHPMTPNAYFFVARLLHEQWAASDRAMKIIEHLTINYPFHENASFVRAYAKQIQA